MSHICKLTLATILTFLNPVLFASQCSTEKNIQTQQRIPWYKQNLGELLFSFSAHQEAEHKAVVARTKQKKEMTEDHRYKRTNHIRQTLLDLVPNMPEDGIIDIIASYDHCPAVLSLAILDNEQIAAGLENGEIHIFDNEQHTKMILKSHKAPIYFLAWQLYNENGEQVLIAGSTVYGYPIYTMHAGRDRFTGDRCFEVKARCQQTTLPTSSQDERLILWNVATATPVRTINPHTQMWGRFGMVMAKLSPDALLNTINSAPIQSVASEICRRITITKEDQFDFENPFSLCGLPRIPKNPLVWAQFPGYFIFGYRNGKCAILYQNKTVEFQTHSGPVRVIKEIAPSIFATAADDGCIVVRSALTRELLQKIDLKEHGAVYALAVLEANTTRPQPIIVSGSADGSLHVTVLT